MGSDHKVVAARCALRWERDLCVGGIGQLERCYVDGALRPCHRYVVDAE